MSTSGKTRVALVGMGGRGEWAALELARSSLYELVAICDTNEGKLDHFRRFSGLEDVRYHTDFARCLDEEDIEAVVVTAHDGAHADLVIPSLEAGKFVFVEKPLDITAARCRAIVEADRKAGGKTFVGFNLRFAPVYAKVRELIEQGAIGKVLTMQADEFYDGGRTYFRRWNRLRSHGGGLWITKASHDFDLLYWFAGCKPVSVCSYAKLSYYVPRKEAPLYCSDCLMKDECPDGFYAMKKRGNVTEKLLSEVAAEHGAPRPDLCLFNSDKDTFDHGMTTVEFDRDILAVYTCNVVTGFSARRIRVSGTKGTIDGEVGGKTVRLRGRDPSSDAELAVKPGSGGHGGADNYLLLDFHGFTKGLIEPKVRPEEAMVAVLIGLAATRSSDERRPVLMSEFGL